MSGNRQYRMEVPVLPQSLDAFVALPGADLSSPWTTAGLTVVALCAYPTHRDAALAMLNHLKGPSPLSTYEKQFMVDRMRGKDYLPLSYFVGATPQNNYTPTQPLALIVEDSPHSYVEQAAGYIQLFVRSGGADAPRPIKLRSKPSTGQWFLWEQMLLSDIRIPVAEDPWN